MKKGFTMIELLLVMAILGVVAAGVVVAMNPGKRIRQANDSKIKNDVGQIATALQAYYTEKMYYPVDLNTLVTSGDLKTLPTPPGGVPANYTYARNAACGASPYTGCEAIVYTGLQEPSTPGWVWCWQSVTGQVSELAACPAP